jgi:hypothetical protein
MAKITIELSWNYEDSEFQSMLVERKLTHLPGDPEKPWLRVGDGLRSKKGSIARVVGRFKNYENSSIDFTIANKTLTQEQMEDHFGIISHP